MLTLAVVIVLSAMADSTMRPLPATAPVEQFRAERALVHLKRFAAEPRPIGSPANARAQTYLAGQLRAAGLEVEVQRAVGAWSAAGLAAFGQVDNVVGRLRGTDSTGTVLIAAHYDSAAMGPGASDGGAAVAAMVETVRALRAGPGPRNDVVLLNWEARGVSGPSLMFETSGNNARLVETFAGAVPAPRGHSAMVEVYRLLPNNIAAEGPRADVLAHGGDTLKLHVTAPKGARSVTLRFDQPITHAIASAGRFGAAGVPVTGTRTGTWPAEIRFRGLPAQGVQLTVRVPAKDRIRLTVIAATDGFTAVGVSAGV
ncbi:M28 family peptidase [Nonomuraea endophytica]|nr:M28 family peptidase [Nonomuraea endophytica]